MFFVYAAIRTHRLCKSWKVKVWYRFWKISENINLNLEATYFNVKYDDVLEGWKTGISSGSAYTTQNILGEVRSHGLE